MKAIYIAELENISTVHLLDNGCWGGLYSVRAVHPPFGHFNGEESASVDAHVL
jgi:hypothetical protein